MSFPTRGGSPALPSSRCMADLRFQFPNCHPTAPRLKSGNHRFANRAAGSIRCSCVWLCSIDSLIVRLAVQHEVLTSTKIQHGA